MTERGQTSVGCGPPQDTGRLGMEIYERKIRERVDHDQKGKIVAIDVDSGEWTISKFRPIQLLPYPIPTRYNGLDIGA